VKGSIQDKGKTYSLEIRAVGIGKIDTPEGETVWFGCRNCDDLFPLAFLSTISLKGGVMREAQI